jgi:anti-sigma regulatory factor (Ser/Thr protein kinase)
MEKRILIARWFGPGIAPILIYDEASVSYARQLVRDAGQHLNLTTEVVESVAVIASELTHNQLSHAKQGYFAVKPIERQGAKGLEVVAGDIGPGVQKPDVALRGRVSAARGSLGAGLGAVSRMADEIEIDNRLAEGVCVVARKFENNDVRRSCEIAIMGRPFPGEVISGDDAVFFQSETGLLASIVDGLGHGPEARKASNRAIEALTANQEISLDQTVVAIDAELAGTRGCAMSVVRFNRNDRTIECALAGDIHAHLYTLREAHFFASTPLVLGTGQLGRQKLRIERTTAEQHSVLVMFTDGLKSRTTLKGQLDVLRQPAIAIAQHLLENDSRPDDHALVLVARFQRSFSK